MNEHIFKFRSNIDNNDVYIAGSFNNWNKKKMNYDNNNQIFYHKIELEDGYYEYKYFIHNEWIYDTNYPVIVTKEGYKNNLLIIVLKKNQTNGCIDYKTIWHTL